MLIDSDWASFIPLSRSRSVSCGAAFRQSVRLSRCLDSINWSMICAWRSLVRVSMSRRCSSSTLAIIISLNCWGWCSLSQMRRIRWMPWTLFVVNTLYGSASSEYRFGSVSFRCSSFLLFSS